MFTIIGGDNKPYGPSTEEEVREWLKQGRADGRTLARRDAGEWKPLAAFPEFADLLGAPGGLPPLPHSLGRGSLPAPTPAEILARDFDLDIFSCIKRAWELVQGNFWPVVGITFLVILAAGGVNQVVSWWSGTAVQDMVTQRKVSLQGLTLFFLTSLICAAVQSLFIGGMYQYYLKLIRGEEAVLGDAFSGFTLAPGQLALVGLVAGVATMLLPVAYLYVLALRGGAVSVASLGVLALCLIPGIYLSVGWFFAMPLVIDRRMDCWSALGLSLRTVNKHWFIMLGLLLVYGLVGACGICVFCIGIFVSMPVGYLMLMYAYEDIFGARAS
jgi:hypothetical protein